MLSLALGLWRATCAALIFSRARFLCGTGVINNLFAGDGAHRRDRDANFSGSGWVGGTGKALCGLNLLAILQPKTR